jgi:hypothetical protein
MSEEPLYIATMRAPLKSCMVQGHVQGVLVNKKTHRLLRGPRFLGIQGYLAHQKPRHPKTLQKH